MEYTEVKRLQKVMLIIAEEIIRICKKNNIKCFVCGGTMLGAVRHKGFIPWDDDMDFAFMREDYDRFIEVCETDLKEEFFLQTWDTDPEYPYPFGKILLKDTFLEEDFTKGTKSIKGIYVDLFPLDSVTEDIKERNKHKREVFILHRALWVKKGYGKSLMSENFMQKIRYLFSKCVFAFFPYEKTKEKYKKVLLKFNDNNTTPYVRADSPYSYEKGFIKREWIDHIVEYEFDGISVPGLKDYDSYLTFLFNDYMQLPDEKDRRTHKLKSLDYGKY